MLTAWQEAQAHRWSEPASMAGHSIQARKHSGRKIWNQHISTCNAQVLIRTEKAKLQYSSYTAFVAINVSKYE